MNYTLKSELGEGGMATVYLAEDHKFHTDVAVKMLKKEFVHNENIRKRFIAEARKMFKMSHPNIIKVSDLIDEGDTVAFVMEYVEGETLKEYIDRKGKLSDGEIKDLFTQMLDAVGYVHKQNLVHRDIKPSNFMIDLEGKVKLMDFGIAKTLDSSSAEYTITGTNQSMGTPMYMSPEQITETKIVSSQSDIYSLGVVLWQMVTGQKPYDIKTLSNYQLQTKIVNEKLPIANSIYDDIIQSTTEKNIDSRLNSCNEVINKIESLILKNINKSKISELNNIDQTILDKRIENDKDKIDGKHDTSNNSSGINFSKEQNNNFLNKNKKSNKKILKWSLGLFCIMLTSFLGYYFLIKVEEKKYLIGRVKNNNEEYKLGFIDVKGNWVIQPMFQSVREFHEGLAVAQINGKWGFIDTKGNWVIQPNFQWVDDFNEGLAGAEINDKFGFIDTKGNWVIQPMFEWASAFHEGLAPARINGKYGFIDSKGNWVIQPMFEWAYEFHEGLASARIKDKYGFIDTKGNWVIQPIFERLSWGGFHEGLAVAEINGKYGFIDTKGNWVIQPIFQTAWDFNEGLAAVEINDKFGFIDTKGNWVIQPMFEYLYSYVFDEGLTAARINNKWGFIDTKGNWVIKPMFKSAEYFNEGLARAQINDKYGYIDTKGNWVIQPIFDYWEDYNDSTAITTADIATQPKETKQVEFTSVMIGNQEWMTENLNVETFRNGDLIPEAKTDEEWIKSGINKRPAWCYYNNDPANGEKYGKLYNWYAVNDPRGLAPLGWHIPSDEEWVILNDYLGGWYKIAGLKLKSTSGWNSEPGNGTNESGFSGLPGGDRFTNGRFYSLGGAGSWWSSTEKNKIDALSHELFFGTSRGTGSKRRGLAVRCLRD
jgi:uncharacterized protein (TIGR02145 family)